MFCYQFGPKMNRNMAFAILAVTKAPKGRGNSEVRSKVVSLENRLFCAYEAKTALSTTETQELDEFLVMFGDSVELGSLLPECPTIARYFLQSINPSLTLLK